MSATETPTTVDVSAQVAAVNAIEAEMNSVLGEMSTAVRMTILSLLGRTHLLMLGERGTAKTMTADLLHSHMGPDVKKFYVLMSKSLPPDVIVGNLSIKGFVERDE